MRSLSPCRGILLSLLLLLAARSPADDGREAYKQSLIGKYPYYQTATQRFAAVFPALAKQILMDYGVHEGVCVDLGGGSGQLAMELVKASRLTAYVVDIDPVAVRLCSLLADEAGLTGRLRGVEGDAQNLPLRDSFADLVVSRNSIFFWPDKLAGLKEANRILKPGGVGYLGGGFSRLLSPEQLAALNAWAAAKRAQNPKAHVTMPESLVADAQAAGIRCRLLPALTPSDWWVEIRK